MSTKNISINLGGFFLPALTLLFIYLKLTAQITWSWFWVLGAITIPLSILGIIAVVALVIFILSVIWQAVTR